MSFLNIALPTTASWATSDVVVSGVTTTLQLFACLVVLTSVFFTFRPLLSGIARAFWVSLFPARSRAQETAERLLRTRLTLRRLANDSELSSPAMVAELQAMSART